MSGFDGHLIAATEGAVAERDLKIKAKNELPLSVNGIIFGSFLAAVLFSIARAVKLRPRLNYLLSSPTWDFSKSWASTFTVVGGLLGTILSSLVLPETTERFSKATLAGLNVLFGVAILLAPLIFAASETLQRLTNKSPESQPQGTVGGYVAASALTLTGVFGQLVTVFFLFDEIERGGALTDAALFFMVALLLLAVIIVVLHAWNSIGWTAANATPPPSTAPPAERAPQPTGAPTPQVAGPAFSPPLL